MSNAEQPLSSHSRATSPEPLLSNVVGNSQRVRSALSVVNSTPELNPSAMASSQDSSVSAPEGIEEDVLAKIDAFLERSEPTRPKLSRRGASNEMEAWWTKPATPSSDQAESAQLSGSQEKGMFFEKDLSPIDAEEALDFDPDKFRLPSSEDSSLDSDEEECSEKDALLSQDDVSASPTEQHHDYGVTDPMAPKIIARYIYPSEHSSPPLSKRQPVPPSTLASLLAMLWVYILSFFISDEPGIVEYSPQEIKCRAGDITVEAQVVEFSAEPEKVVGVMALIHVGDDEQVHAFPITAKPKRVRDLIKDEVGRTPEDVYRKQIKGALKALQKMAD